jgi:uncharacterized protein with HEPN domain
MSRDISLYIVDIFIAINKIKRYTAKFQTADEFLWSEVEWDATIRELEIIGEATKHLLNNGVLDKKYRKIVDFRNVISHGYFGIDEDEVWFVIKEKLDEFFDDLLDVIKSNNINILKALEFAKVENSKNEKLVEFMDIMITRITKGEKNEN